RGAADAGRGRAGSPGAARPPGLSPRRAPARRRGGEWRSGARRSPAAAHPSCRTWYGTAAITTRSHGRGDPMNIRPNRLKQTLAAGRVATIIGGSKDTDLIDQLGPIGEEGYMVRGGPGGVVHI